MACACGRFHFDERTTDGGGVGDGIVDDAGVVQRGCVAQMSSSGNDVCVRRPDGHVWCWGYGAAGQLGTGLFGDNGTPVETLVTDAIAISTGENTACAIRADHSLVCWGRNNMNQLGDGTMSDQPAPVPLAVPPLVVEVRLGEYHGCARLSDGTGRCWGDNVGGELNQPASGVHATPTDAPAVGSATQFSISDESTCVLGANRVLGCFGINDQGDLGDSTTSPHDQPTPPVILPDPVTSVAGGCHRHSCAVTDQNEVWCWGQNASGELGSGAPSTFEATPVKVVGLPPSAQVAVGAFHTCARTLAGEIWCWGDGQGGTLGDGLSHKDFTPKRVDGFTGNPVDLQASCGATHVRRDDGTLVGWGTRLSVGTDPATDALSPVEVNVPCQ